MKALDAFVKQIAIENKFEVISFILGEELMNDYLTFLKSFSDITGSDGKLDETLFLQEVEKLISKIVGRLEEDYHKKRIAKYCLNTLLDCSQEAVIVDNKQQP